jgi:6-phosphofructo-2-kinase/fructose-2,6-biphosphatase
MGNAHSATVSGNGAENSGGQLFVALKLEKPDGQPMPLDAVPHVTGSMPIVGSWDPAKAVSNHFHVFLFLYIWGSMCRAR